MLTVSIKKMLVLCPMFVIASAAIAQDTPAEFDYRGDAKKGEAAANVCAACHAKDGNSAVSTFPKLAGQHARYTYKQLNDMKAKDGEEPARPVAQMAGIVANMSKAQMADLAAYFEEQSTTVEGADPDLIELGETIYRSGNPETQVPACTGCHQPDGSGLGLAGYPQLAGQHSDYTVKQLMAFRAAAREDINAEYRTNDGETMQMRLSAEHLSDKEILAVSAYISGLQIIPPAANAGEKDESDKSDH